MKDTFVYIWIDARNPITLFYIGRHKGLIEDRYTHSSTLFEKFYKECIPKGIHRRILGRGTEQEMVDLEHKLLTNRKKKCWERYYNMHTGGSYGWRHVNDNILPEVRMKNCIKGGEAFKIKHNTDPDFAQEHARKASYNSKLRHKEGRMKSIHDHYSWVGKKHTEKTKQKMRETHKSIGHQQGSTNSQYGTMWITDGIYNKKISRDTTIPDGWSKGRSMKDKSRVDNRTTGH